MLDCVCFCQCETAINLLQIGTTHLIAEQPIGHKYEAAIRAGIKVMKKSWLHDSIVGRQLHDDTHPRYRFGGYASSGYTHL